MMKKDRLTEDRRPMTADRGRPPAASPGPQSSVSGPGPRSPVPGPQRYKFQDLQVYQLALSYLDGIYELTRGLPEVEKYNLRSQMERAATSVVLNIAEGSTGQSDPEQSRFVSMALRSYLETVACLDIAERRQFLGSSDLQPIRDSGHQLFVKLSALRRSLTRPPSPVNRREVDR